MSTISAHTDNKTQGVSPPLKCYPYVTRKAKNQKSTYRINDKCLILLVHQEGFEPPTYGFVVRFFCFHLPSHTITFRTFYLVKIYSCVIITITSYHFQSPPFMQIVGDNVGDKIETYGFLLLSRGVYEYDQMDHRKRGYQI